MQGTAYVLFKMNFHPNWNALVDGKPTKVFALSPGFMGISVDSGIHDIDFQYKPDRPRIVLCVVAFVTTLGFLIAVGLSDECFVKLSCLLFYNHANKPTRDAKKQ